MAFFVALERTSCNQETKSELMPSPRCAVLIMSLTCSLIAILSRTEASFELDEVQKFDSQMSSNVCRARSETPLSGSFTRCNRLSAIAAFMSFRAFRRYTSFSILIERFFTPTAGSLVRTNNVLQTSCSRAGLRRIHFPMSTKAESRTIGDLSDAHLIISRITFGARSSNVGSLSNI